MPKTLEGLLTGRVDTGQEEPGGQLSAGFATDTGLVRAMAPDGPAGTASRRAGAVTGNTKRRSSAR